MIQRNTYVALKCLQVERLVFRRTELVLWLSKCEENIASRSKSLLMFYSLTIQPFQRDFAHFAHVTYRPQTTP